jgi:uncharacterized protein (DUF924 family)
MAETIDEVLAFWFAEGRNKAWFVKDEAFDTQVRSLLAGHSDQAAAGEYDDWKDSGRGCVALVILLDQVPRNLFRDDPRAYASDEKALAVTRHALRLGLDVGLSQVERVFLYLPLEHSESLEDQTLCCDLIEKLDEDPNWHLYALRHREVIERFGRFPHRNAVLGRRSTPEERDFLEQNDTGF